MLSKQTTMVVTFDLALRQIAAAGPAVRFRWSEVRTQADSLFVHCSLNAKFGCEINISVR